MDNGTLLKLLMLVVSCQISEIYSRVLSTRQSRLSLAEPSPSYYYNNIDGNPGAYAFGYEAMDPTGNPNFRNEERYPNGTVTGSYGYVDPNGRPHRYRYVADERGYRVFKDPPQPAYVASPAVNRPSSYVQPNEVTWTRRKPNPPRYF